MHRKFLIERFLLHKKRRQKAAAIAEYQKPQHRNPDGNFCSSLNRLLDPLILPCAKIKAVNRLCSRSKPNEHRMCNLINFHH